MKMITAIINRKDATEVCDSLAEGGFTFTRMASTGGFLKAGNITLLIGIDDEKVDDALDIIRRNCARRMEHVPSVVSGNVHAYGYYKTEVLVGGATVFVTPIERFEKM